VPSRKQRRRQQKQRRHEWEEVYVDDEGNEVPVEEIAPDRTPAKPAERKASANGKPKPSARPAQRAGRVIQPPSWQRVLKRGAIFAPIMFLVVYWLNKGNEDHSVSRDVLQTAILLLAFVPFSYFMDSMLYRGYLKRTGQQPSDTKKR
jgi:hypothetical protein